MRIHRFRLQEPCYVIPESRQTLLFQCDQSKALIAHRSTRSASFSHIQFQEKTKTKQKISYAGLNFNRAIV